MIKLLPRWICSNRSASFYDVESVNIMEATGQLQGKMNELIEDYNKFVDEINKTITEFVTDVNADQECFKKAITELVENYIKSIDLKIDNQDLVIKEAVDYMKTNIQDSVSSLLNEMKENGELNETITTVFNNIETRVQTLENTEYTLEYDGTVESLKLVKKVGGV